MATVQSYPHLIINVRDNSIYIPTNVEILPIFRPLFIMKTQKGEANKVEWYNTYSEATAALGEETFNMLNTKYYSQASYFLTQMFENNGAFIARVVDADATTAFMIIEAHVVEKAIVQYQKDSLGNRLYDTTGEFIPETDNSNEVVTAPGVEITWKTRFVLATGETMDKLDELQVRTVVDGTTTTTIYPMFTFKASSPGSHGNYAGISLYYDTDYNVDTQVERVGSVFYNFAPIEKEYAGTTVDSVRDFYGNTLMAFTSKANNVDPATDAYVSFAESANVHYPAGYVLPYAVNIYSNNFETIGNLIRNYENEDRSAADQIESGYQVNIMSGKDLSNLYYNRLAFGDESITLANGVNYYLQSGDDGDTSDTTIENLIKNFLELDLNPDIVDNARYPFTHLIDVGYHLEVKKEMCDFLAVREDVKVYLSTQQVTNSTINGITAATCPNTAATDASVCTSLRARALLMRESVLKGTQCCRATIFMQAGIPAGTNYKKWLPATLWIATKLAEYDNGQKMNLEPRGLPNADVSLWSQLNWIPASEDTKRATWNLGGNYCQYYTRTNLHYADVRSVYSYDTSVLVNDTFTNAIVYSKHEIRQSWAKFTGVTTPAAVLQEQIEADVAGRFNSLFNGKYTFTVDAYQTDEDKKLGFLTRIKASITSPATNRVWDFEIVCNRENYNTEG